MAVHGSHEIYIKPESEDVEVKCDPRPGDDKLLICDAHASDMVEEIVTNCCYDVKHEPEANETEEEVVLSENEYKLEIDVEATYYDELCNTDIEESKINVVKAEKTSYDDSVSIETNSTVRVNDTGNKNLVNNSNIVPPKKRRNRQTNIELFQCDQCSFETTVKANFRRHLGVHKIPTLKCEKCPYWTKEAASLSEHIRVHTEERPYKCEKCSFRGKTKTHLKYHQSVHTDVRPFKCDKCHYSAKIYPSLTQHQKIHTDVKPYKCDKCNYRTRKLYNLKKHQIHHHSSDIVCKENTFECDINTEDNNGAQTCHHSNDHLTNNTGQTNMALQVNHEVYIKTENENAEERYDHPGDAHPMSETHISNMKEEEEEAMICFDVKHELDANQDDETEEVVSETEYKLEVEVETYDEFCNADANMVKAEKTADDSSVLETNRQKNIELFKCDQCSFNTKVKRNFKRHLGIHNITILECEKCSFWTKEAANLSDHIRVHTEERSSYKCEKCSFQGRTKTEYRYHQSVHTDVRPFKCDKCDYAAKIYPSLVRHQKNHTDVKPYKCEKCDYAAKMYPSLVRHQKNHTDVKPYKCDKCNHRTRELYNLKKHQRVQHSTDLICQQPNETKNII